MKKIMFTLILLSIGTQITATEQVSSQARRTYLCPPCPRVVCPPTTQAEEKALRERTPAQWREMYATELREIEFMQRELVIQHGLLEDLKYLKNDKGVEETKKEIQLIRANIARHVQELPREVALLVKPDPITGTYGLKTKSKTVGFTVPAGFEGEKEKEREKEME